MSERSLAGSVALVTGAGRGIGRYIAEGLGAAGAAVACVGRDEHHLAGAVRQIESGGGRAAAVIADVTDPSAVAAAIAATESALGPVDLLVNNAGLIESRPGPLWRADLDEWWRVIEVDLRGPALTSHAVLPGMIERGRGRIVSISTGSGTRANADYSAYSAAKTALIRLNECLAESLVGTGVCVFDVAPGVVRTDMTLSMPMWDGLEDWTPPERVVEMIRAIAEGRLDHMSGRYIRSTDDEVEALTSAAERIAETGARRLRLRGYGADDPVARPDGR